MPMMLKVALFFAGLSAFEVLCILAIGFIIEDYYKFMREE